MTGRLYIIEPEAEAELEQAADTYEESVPGLGLEFLLEMRERTRDVLNAPHRFPPYGGVEGAQCGLLGTSIAKLIVSVELASAHTRVERP